MSLLAHLTAASIRVSETSSRLEKTRELAQALRAVEPDEIPIAIAWLSGETCQGKIGASYASLQDVGASAAAAGPSLELPDVDRLTREMVSRAESWCAGRLVASLEGGYVPERLGQACVVTLEALGAGA